MYPRARGLTLEDKPVIGALVSEGKNYSIILQNGDRHQCRNSTIVRYQKTLTRAQILQRVDLPRFRRHMTRNRRSQCSPKRFLTDWMSSDLGVTVRIEGDQIVAEEVCCKAPDWVMQVCELGSSRIPGAELLRELGGF